MKIGTTRVETFSDSVIAIIITVMLLSMKMPDFTKDGTHWSVRHHLYQILPYIVTYSFSFMMIGIFWINHHHMYHFLEKTDEVLLIENLVFLFCMSFIPLATAFVGANPLISESVAFYGLVLLVTTFSFTVMRTHAIKKKLLYKDRDRNLTSKVYAISLRARTKAYIGTIAYSCSLPLAFMNVYLAFICFVIPPVLFFIPDGIDDEELAERIADKNKV